MIIDGDSVVPPGLDIYRPDLPRTYVLGYFLPSLRDLER